MNIPTIFDWIERFDFLRGTPAVYVVLVTAVLIALFWDWRLSLAALILQYLVVSLLFVDLLDPRLAIVKLITGMFVCLILFWTARQVNYGRLPADLSQAEIAEIGEAQTLTLGHRQIALDTVVRLGLTMSMLVVIALLLRQPTLRLPGVPEDLSHIDTAVLLLMGLGLVAMAAGRDPLPAGMGLLTLLTGFELFYSAVDQSVEMLALLSALNLSLAVAITYLTQARRASWYALIR